MNVLAIWYRNVLSRMWIQRKASCDRFPRVLLFPEGTTTNGKFLISFQLGAFIPAYPIQPVIVRYPHVHFDQSWYDVPSFFDPFFHRICLSKFLRCCIFVLMLLGLIFWHAILLRGDVSLGKLMFRMFTQFHNFMEVCSLTWILNLNSWWP